MNIGITGGSTLVVIGDRAEVVAFFYRVRTVADRVSGNVALVSDRLYARYLRPAELAPTSVVLSEVIHLLSATASACEAQMHEKLLRGFRRCADSANVNFEAFKDTDGYTYEPVRIVIADLPWFSVEKHRSLEEYDRGLGDPLWLRAG